MHPRVNGLTRSTTYYQVKKCTGLKIKNNAITLKYCSHFALTAIKLNKLLVKYDKPSVYDKVQKCYVDFHPCEQKIT
jgi:hypothetical protein